MFLLLHGILLVSINSVVPLVRKIRTSRERALGGQGRDGAGREEAKARTAERRECKPSFFH
jgi:hypothetical protein